MAKDKRIIRHPWGRRKNGSWVIQVNELINALKDGDIAEFGELQVGARQLRQLIACMDFPDEELLITYNNQLEVQNIKRVIVSKNGQRRTSFRKPKLHHSFRIMNKAWLKNTSKPQTTLVIKPRKYA